MAVWISMVKSPLRGLGIFVFTLGLLCTLYLATVLPFFFGREKVCDLFINPAVVTIAGYSGQAMEPFISPDGRFLFFNNENDGRVDLNLHYAERVGSCSFRYVGELTGANSKNLDAVASMDSSGNLFFTTTREYDQTLKSVFVGKFNGKNLTVVRPVAGEIHPKERGRLNMDVGISPDGSTLYISRARFGFLSLLTGAPLESHLLLARREGEIFSLDPAGGELLNNLMTGTLEYAPAVSSTGLEIFFTRASIPTGMRIMVASRTSTTVPFSEPHVLKSITGFVEAPTLSLDGKEIFFHQKIGGKFVIVRGERNQ